MEETLNPNDIEILFQHLTITNTTTDEQEEDHVVDDSDYEEEEEFSFMSIGADDALMDGEMIFPLFNNIPHVHKVFIEMGTHQMTSTISGPYCDLSSRKVVDNSDDCKKSNSTGFSKIWRFKDHLIGRSNSEGRDAFVILDNKATVVNVEKKVKKANKGKTSSSSHEVYLKRRAKDEKRRRPSSYLPYRPELMGFFTSVNGGGLTRNLHPY